MRPPTEAALIAEDTNAPPRDSKYEKPSDCAVRGSVDQKLDSPIEGCSFSLEPRRPCKRLSGGDRELTDLSWPASMA